jgi:O-acetyl-ADP-ribose deacetylase (regulator of RNase III)
LAAKSASLLFGAASVLRLREVEMPAEGKTCFVIMPFGEKRDIDGKVIDFDKVYQHLIKKSVESLEIPCTRCDEIAEAGWIHSKMFQHIYESDVAVIDITSLNPNVFYELGVRHALVDSVTVLLRRKNTTIPFNIQGFQVIEYDPEDMASVDEAKKKIVDFIRNGLTLKKKDSPVHEVLNLRIGAVPREISRTEVFEYQLRNVRDKYICLITGDIRNVTGIDVWVNSENTNMQMARHFDRSISSVIRYCGAKKKGGRVTVDSIAKELAEVVGDQASVPAGEIVVTGAGELERTHRVKKIFHAAAAVGQVGTGYTPISDVGMCVRNALEAADSDDLRSLELKSILFPLLGTGTARGDVQQKAKELIHSAIFYLERHQQCTIQRVYFLTWSERDLEICQQVLQEAREVAIAHGALHSI